MTEEEPVVDRKTARAAYMRRWRQATGTYDTKAQSKATREAARRYREEHPSEWAHLLYEERAKVQRAIREAS